MALNPQADDVFGNWTLVIDPSVFRHYQCYDGRGNLTHTRMLVESTVSEIAARGIACHVQKRQPNDANGVAPYRVRHRLGEAKFLNLIARLNELRGFKGSPDYHDIYYWDEQHLLLLRMIYRDFA